MGAFALAGAGAAMGERSEKCDGKGGQRHLIEGARFAADSPLEGTGFEPSVPLRDRKFADSLLEGTGFEPSVPRGEISGGTDGLWTLRWREMDSKPRFRARGPTV